MRGPNAYDELNRTHAEVGAEQEPPMRAPNAYEELNQTLAKVEAEQGLSIGAVE